MEQREPFAVLREGTLLALVATAFVFFVGYLAEIAYYGRLGVQASELDFPASYFMAQSFGVLALPVLLLTAIVVGDYGLAWLRHREEPGDYQRPPELFAFVPPTVMAAAVSLYWLGFHFAALGDGAELGRLANRVPVLGISVIDLLLHTLFVILAGSMLLSPVRKRTGTLSGPLVGQTKASRVWFAVIAVFFMLMSAALSGTDRGNDAAWAAWECESVPLAVLEPTPPGVSEGHDYWLVLHRGGQYYLRDLETAPGDRNLTVVRADLVDQMSLTWTESRKC